MKFIGRACGIGLLLSLAVEAAETRIWTSRKGTNLEAQLHAVEGTEVTLLTGDSREVKLKVEDLSLADRQYLVEFGGAAPEVVIGGDLGEPENEVRIDTKTFRQLEKPLVLGESEDLSFELLETEHFLVATTGMRQKFVAETAERMWHGMAFEHMNFRKDWGDSKFLVILVDDAEVYTKLGKWYEAYLREQGADGDVIMQIAASWDQSSAPSIGIPRDLMAEWNMKSRARVFHITKNSPIKKAMSPFLVHSFAGELIRLQMGGVSEYGADGYFAVVTGFSYHKEIHLAGRSNTVMLDVSGSQFDDITKTSGFEDGRSWARTLRKLVKRDKVTPDFEKMMSWKARDLDPEKLVLIYSFGAYCNSTPERLSGFANLVRRVEASDQIPEPIEFARLMGFESVEELQADWVEFVTSTSFK